LSPKEYNEKTSLLLACAMTTEIKGYPFEVLLPDGKAAILADQVKCLDWQMRNVQPKDRVPDEILQQVRDLLRVLLQI
jgi:mRNA interferase MazF